MLRGLDHGLGISARMWSPERRVDGPLALMIVRTPMRS
jgi:hypothetical protein